MLEIRNVTKIYRTKGGVITRALDDVSISFGETGMVFLLGKSGSGKSTLLNVSGGLDEPTSGEIIVKGKSSKSFSGADFDSYRNTFVGFIFQEYNILDEFNVEDNIALALELQGKSKDRDKINSLLREVDLEAYAKRKPNTLSGGQKQRIAIARALVKDPQIIMADEPTGALDSATGKQVFDTLKKLSETRLVIIVSHDREFAEIYGDRIVELKDGKIISDVTKTRIAAEQLDSNLSVIDGNTLSLKRGSELNEQNFKTIRDFIAASDGDIIISRGEREISAFRKASRMSEAGETERFDCTDPKNIALKEYAPGEACFIRSRLPAGKAIKIGASGLKLKPFRLVLTILLSIIAFTMFGLFSTLMVYDGDKVLAESFVQSEGNDYIQINKYYQTRYIYDDGYVYSFGTDINFTQNELDGFTQKYGSSVFGCFTAGNPSVSNVIVAKKNAAYYDASVSKFAYIPDGHPVRNLTAGTYPEDETQICISSYLAQIMQNSDVYAVKQSGGNLSVDTDTQITVNGVQDCVGKYIVMNLGGEYVKFKISGVFDSGEIPEKYDDLKTSSDYSYLLYYNYVAYLDETMCKLALVSDNFYETYKDKVFGGIGVEDYQQYFSFTNTDLTFKTVNYIFSDDDFVENGLSDINYFYSQAVSSYGAEPKLDVMFLDGDSRTSLNNYEIIPDMTEMPQFREAITRQLYERKLNEGGYDTNEEAYYAALIEWQGYETKLWNYFNGYRIQESEDEDGNYYSENVELTASELSALLAEISDFISQLKPLQMKLIVNDSLNFDFTVVGFHVGNDYISGLYLPQSFIDGYIEMWEDYQDYKTETNYVGETDTVYGGIYIPYDHTEKAIAEIIAITGADNRNENDVYYLMQSSLYETVLSVNGLADSMGKVFLIIGIVFAVFSALLMFNFISMSISNKRKEIGILRAVGARGVDVFKIFFSEAGIIVGICTVLSLILAFISVGIINNVVRIEAGLGVTVFVFGFASLGMMLGIAVLIAFISTFLPVYFAARKKPVESIRAL